MIQTKFDIHENQMQFLNRYKNYGFKNKSALVRKAIEVLQKQIEQDRLLKSAELYAEIYQEDKEIQKLTHAAISEWPE